MYGIPDLAGSTSDDVVAILNGRQTMALRKPSDVFVGTVLLDRANRIKWSSKRVCV